MEEIRVEIDKCVVNLEDFKFVGGDLTLDLKGKIFMSPKIENSRMSLNGAFNAAPKLGEAFFLYIVDKQKNADGNYPLNIGGRLGKPSVKIGTFPLPISWEWWKMSF